MEIPSPVAVVERLTTGYGERDGSELVGVGVSGDNDDKCRGDPVVLEGVIQVVDCRSPTCVLSSERAYRDSKALVVLIMRSY